jgi:hypothetical protein
MVSNLTSFLGQFTGTAIEITLDVDKTSDFMASVEGDVSIPMRFQMLLYKARLYDYVQFGKLPEFKIGLSNGIPGIKKEDIQGTCGATHVVQYSVFIAKGAIAYPPGKRKFGH